MKVLIALKIWLMLSQPAQMGILQHIVGVYKLKHQHCSKVCVEVTRNMDFAEIKVYCCGYCL